MHKTIFGGPHQVQSLAGTGGAYPDQQPTNVPNVPSSPISISISNRPSSSVNFGDDANTGSNTTSGCTTPPSYRPKKNSQSTDSINSGSSNSSEDEDYYPDDADLARAYLEAQGIEVDLEDSNGITALMVAAWEGEEDIVENLLIVRVPVNCVNAATGDNALILAASLGHARIVDHLLNVTGIDLNKTNKNGDTALMLASSGKWPNVAKSLLKHGAKADLVNPRRGYNALMLASAYGCAPIVELLLDTPSVNLNQANPRGDNALILACAGKHRDAAELLLKKGAITTTVGSHGHTALGMAMEAKDGAIVELLIDMSPETVDDLKLSADLQDAFSVTVTDLQAITNGSAQFVSSGQPLDFFKTLSGLVPADGDTGALVRWLRQHGLLTACAREVASLLAPAHAWALQAGHGKTGGMEQQRLIYCTSALGRIMATGAKERVSKNYQNAGISEGGMSRLGKVAEEQLRELENLAAEAAAEFGGDLVNSMIEHCCNQTNPRYELRASVLRDCLVREGFMEPIANVIASSWQSVLAQMQQEKINITPNLSFLEAADYMHQYFIKDAEVRLARALQVKIQEHKLLNTVNVMQSAKDVQAVPVLYQIQCNWVSQFCAQSIKSN